MKILIKWIGKTIKFSGEHVIPSWTKEIDYADKYEYIKNNLDYEVRKIITTKILESIELQYDSKIVDKIAKELLESFNFKEAIEKEMHEKIASYIKDSSNTYRAR